MPPLTSTRGPCPICRQIVGIWPTTMVRRHRLRDGRECPAVGRRLRQLRPRAEWRVIDCPSCGGFADCPRCAGSEVLWIRPSGHLFLHPGGPARGSTRPAVFITAIRVEPIGRVA